MISLITTRFKLLAVTALVMLSMGACVGCKRVTRTASPSVEETVDALKEAVANVEQDRGEAVGRNATVEVPAQLKHYANRQRFLAVQEADSQAQSDVISRDFVDLVRLIKRGELIEMKALGGDYILYGVGYNVSGEPLARYDVASKQDVPLAASEVDFKEEVQRASEMLKESAGTLKRLEIEWRRLSKRDRARRAKKLAEVARARKAVATSRARVNLLSAVYKDPARRKAIVAEYQLVSEAARDFDGEAYDLNDPDARRRFKIRLLSFIRPEAREALIQIAHGYSEKFKRPLPVSSLVRPVQYQRELGETNANVARGALPPHSSGLAFDLYYRYMTAAEQEYLMSVIAGLKDEGRVEALRELRDHIHVYVFGNGQRPEERLIARVIVAKESRKLGKTGTTGRRGRTGKTYTRSKTGPTRHARPGRNGKLPHDDNLLSF